MAALEEGVKGYPNPFEALSEALNRYGTEEKGPFPFNGGFAGYLSYDLKDFLASCRGSASPRTKERPGLDTPLSSLGFYPAVIVYDHRDEEAFLVTIDEKRSSVQRSRILKALQQPRPPRQPPPLHGVTPFAGRISSNMTRGEYIEAIEKAKRYIAEGDIYQINLSQRLSIPFPGDAFALYASLLKTRPAPNTAFMDFGPFQIISNSPERLLSVEGTLVTTSPIKGTRPRGATREEDGGMIEALKASVKERAEHVMIVDLERNDLGRVCVPGSVTVDGFEAIETYTTLHHMVSNVRGVLRPGAGPVQCLQALFPGGSVTGAPKIRAMEIIDEIETVKRGIYTGAIGWVDACGGGGGGGGGGGMDMAIAIRTAVVKENLLHLHVGGGIVADSVPEDEYGETILKARDFLDLLAPEPQG